MCIYFCKLIIFNVLKLLLMTNIEFKWLKHIVGRLSGPPCRTPVLKQNSAESGFFNYILYEFALI